MEVKIEKMTEVFREAETKEAVTLYNPEALDHTLSHRVKSIERTDEYTRIDFIYRSSNFYVNGGWIQIDENSYISIVGSNKKYRLIKAFGIPLAPLKHYFKKQGEFHTYSLIFPALPSDTNKIDVIEKLAPGSYFNFYGIDYSKWITIPHPADIAQSRN